MQKRIAINFCDRRTFEHVCNDEIHVMTIIIDTIQKSDKKHLVAEDKMIVGGIAL